MNDTQYVLPQSITLKLQTLDFITLNHSTRVAEIARSYEKYMGYEDKLLSTSALVHDIGKLYISPKILDKPDVLSSLERDIINLHPYISYEMLMDEDVNIEICLIALYHHGLNPPQLKNNELNSKELLEEIEDDTIKERIKEYSRVLHTIDSYEALTSDRPYRRGFNSEEAIEIMVDDKNSHPYVIEFLQKVNNL